MTDYNGVVAGIVRLIDQTIRSRRMSDVFSGTVIKTSPLTVKADGHELDGDFIVNACTTLAVGDAVVLIRKEGGQKYYLIAKVQE